MFEDFQAMVDYLFDAYKVRQKSQANKKANKKAMNKYKLSMQVQVGHLKQTEKFIKYSMNDVGLSILMHNFV